MSLQEGVSSGYNIPAKRWARSQVLLFRDAKLNVYLPLFIIHYVLLLCDSLQI